MSFQRLLRSLRPAAVRTQAEVTLEDEIALYRRRAEMALREERWNDASAIVDPTGVGPRVFIQKVPEPKSAKNRVHLDVRVSTDRTDKDRERMLARADELVAIGATLVRVVDDNFMGYWIVMSDPEGNEFCLV